MTSRGSRSRRLKRSPANINIVPFFSWIRAADAPKTWPPVYFGTSTAHSRAREENRSPANRIVSLHAEQPVLHTSIFFFVAISL